MEFLDLVVQLPSCHDRILIRLYFSSFGNRQLEHTPTIRSSSLVPRFLKNHYWVRQLFLFDNYDIFHSFEILKTKQKSLIPNIETAVGGKRHNLVQLRVIYRCLTKYPSVTSIIIRSHTLGNWEEFFRHCVAVIKLSFSWSSIRAFLIAFNILSSQFCLT